MDAPGTEPSPSRPGPNWVSVIWPSPFRRSTTLTWIVGALVFFRRSFASGFDGLSGDNGDWRLISVLHEHLFKALQGTGSWNNPNFFYPAKNALGFSDTFALNQLFYTPLRAIGFDRYAALQWTLILLTGVGFFGLTALFDRTTTLPDLWTCCLATVFTFANSVAIAVGHPQLYGIYWLPWVALMAVNGQRDASNRRYLWFAGSGSLSALVVYSSFYIGWFFVLSVGIAAAYFSLLQITTAGFRPYADQLRAHLRSGAAVLAGFVVSLAPFLYTYLPVLRSTQKRSYSEAMSFAGRPGDLINVSKWNVLWGPFVRRFFEATPARLTNGEIALAMTPIAIGLTLAIGFSGFRTRRTDRDLRENLVLGLACTWVTMSLLAIKFGFGSAWIVPYTLVPGANAIRAIFRIQIFNLVPAALTLGFGLDLWLHRRTPADTDAIHTNRAPLKRNSKQSKHSRNLKKSKRTRTFQPPRSVTQSPRAMTVVSVLLVLAVVEQFNRSTQSKMDRSNELRLMIATRDAPKSCRSFYLIPRPGAAAYETNIDAMVIASSKQLPTLNGYSGQFPSEFPYDSTLPTYIQDIQHWAQRTGVAQGVCALDRVTGEWSTVDLPA